MVSEPAILTSAPGVIGQDTWNPPHQALSATVAAGDCIMCPWGEAINGTLIGQIIPISQPKIVDNDVSSLNILLYW